MAGFLQGALSNIRGLIGNVGSQIRAFPEYATQLTSRFSPGLTDYVGASQTGGNMEIPPLSPTRPPIQPQPQAMAEYGVPTPRNPAAPTEEVPNDINLAINQAAEMYGVPAELLFDLAFSESGFNPAAENPNSTAAGLFQFTQPTWLDVLRMAQTPESGLNLMPEATPLDPEAAALAAAYLISQGQLGRWNASQGGWGQFYSPEELAPYRGVR